MAQKTVLIPDRLIVPEVYTSWCTPSFGANFRYPVQRKSRFLSALIMGNGLWFDQQQAAFPTKPIIFSVSKWFLTESISPAKRVVIFDFKESKKISQLAFLCIYFLLCRLNSTWFMKDGDAYGTLAPIFCFWFSPRSELYSISWNILVACFSESLWLSVNYAQLVWLCFQIDSHFSVLPFISHWHQDLQTKLPRKRERFPDTSLRHYKLAILFPNAVI